MLYHLSGNSCLLKEFQRKLTELTENLEIIDVSGLFPIWLIKNHHINTKTKEVFFKFSDTNYKAIINDNGNIQIKLCDAQNDSSGILIKEEEIINYNNFNYLFYVSELEEQKNDFEKSLNFKKEEIKALNDKIEKLETYSLNVSKALIDTKKQLAPYLKIEEANKQRLVVTLGDMFEDSNNLFKLRILYTKIDFISVTSVNKNDNVFFFECNYYDYENKRNSSSGIYSYTILNSEKKSIFKTYKSPKQGRVFKIWEYKTRTIGDIDFKDTKEIPIIVISHKDDNLGSIERWLIEEGYSFGLVKNKEHK